MRAIYGGMCLAMGGAMMQVATIDVVAIVILAVAVRFERKTA